MPEWANKAWYRLDRELVKPYIDKSIGILRSEMSKVGSAGSRKILKDLLLHLDILQPSKALRHRLMLMRASDLPLTDESISRSYSSSGESGIEWYRPVVELSKDRLTVGTTTSAFYPDREKFEVDALTSFCLELAEFFLSRLRLRKSERHTEGKYESGQIVESSPIWRQGYLKALQELGFDLSGKVHKTLNFIKKSDPDEGVRAIAGECYSSVRRNSKSNHTAQELRRGIIAAEWWLLISQRLELKEEVDFEGARNTRRRLLRST